MHNRNIFTDNLKLVCIGIAAIKTVFVPISLIIAQLLSTIVMRAVEGDVGMVIKNTVLIFFLMIVSAILKTISDILVRSKKSKSINKYKLDFMGKFFQNSHDKLFQAEHGELVENLNNDIDSITSRFTELLPSIISGAILSITYMIFLTVQSPLVAVSLIIIALLQIFPPIIVKKYMQVNYNECREIEAQITEHIVQAIVGFNTIKLYGLKQWWQNRLCSYHKDYINVGRKADTIAMARRSMYKLLDNILKFGTYILIGIYVVNGYCSMDIAVQAIYLSGGLFSAVNSFFSKIADVAVSQSAEERLNKWILQKDISAELSTSDIGSIELKDVYYSYGKNSVIKGITYQFGADRNYLLLGGNGEGKSTLINLLTGLIIPDSGKVFSGGNRESEIFYKTLFYIPQNDPAYGFSASTLFNMFGDKEQRVCNSIARRLGLTEENINGNVIRELSGGERKKVFLSIAFAIQPEWLLLDEPTNNLDDYGKKVLCELIQERRSTIIISHDPVLHTIPHFTLKIENGCIAC